MRPCIRILSWSCLVWGQNWGPQVLSFSWPFFWCILCTGGVDLQGCDSSDDSEEKLRYAIFSMFVKTHLWGMICLESFDLVIVVELKKRHQCWGVIKCLTIGKMTAAEVPELLTMTSPWVGRENTSNSHWCFRVWTFASFLCHCFSVKRMSTSSVPRKQKTRAKRLKAESRTQNGVWFSHQLEQISLLRWTSGQDIG